MFLRFPLAEFLCNEPEQFVGRLGSGELHTLGRCLRTFQTTGPDMLRVPILQKTGPVNSVPDEGL